MENITGMEFEMEEDITEEVDPDVENLPDTYYTYIGAALMFFFIGGTVLFRIHKMMMRGQGGMEGGSISGNGNMAAAMALSMNPNISDDASQPRGTHNGVTTHPITHVPSPYYGPMIPNSGGLPGFYNSPYPVQQYNAGGAPLPDPENSHLPNSAPWPLPNSEPSPLPNSEPSPLLPVRHYDVTNSGPGQLPYENDSILHNSDASSHSDGFVAGSDYPSAIDSSEPNNVPPPAYSALYSDDNA